jgi:hypothetical protein
VIRKTLNASRLQAEVSRRIHRIHEVVEDGVKIRVPRPHTIEPDASGCNWEMKHFGNAIGYERDIATVSRRCVRSTTSRKSRKKRMTRFPEFR